MGALRAVLNKSLLLAEDLVRKKKKGTPYTLDIMRKRVVPIIRYPGA